MTLEPEFLLTIREFLGWCLVINAAFLMLSTLGVVAARERISKIHARLFELDETSLPGMYFRYLAYFKIAVIVFNFTPYLALRIVT